MSKVPNADAVSKAQAQGRGPDDIAILEYRKAGLSYRKIAEQMGCSVSTVYEAVKRAMAVVSETTAQQAKVIRDTELERLDELQVALWSKARGRPARGTPGDPNYQPAVEPDMKAVDRLLRIMERRAKLLGIDAPERFEHTGANGGAIEVQDARAALLSKLTQTATAGTDRGGD